jgi:plasmid maintenance system antidote protein VapI
MSSIDKQPTPFWKLLNAGGDSEKFVAAISSGKRDITDTASRLGRFFGTSARRRLNIQNCFEVHSADRDAIEREVMPKQAGLICHPCCAA